MATEYPPLGKSFVSGYANNDRDYPIISIRKDPRVENYKIPDDLSAHPDSVRYPNHVFTGARPTNSDERVQWDYEILPAPWVPFTRYDDDLGPVQGRRRSVKNEGQVASLTASTRTTYEAREGSAIVYTEIEENWSTATDSDGNSLFPLKTRDFYDELRGPVQETRQLFVPDGTEEGSIVNNNGVITKTSYEVYNQYLSFKVIETWSETGENLTGTQTGQWGIETTRRTLATTGTSTEYGFGVKTGVAIPSNKEQNELRTERYPEDTDGDGIIYSLFSQEQDETSKAIISVEKSLVDASRAETIANSKRNDAYIVEVQPLDKWHSITVASKVTGEPSGQSWSETGQISLPDELLEVGIIWDQNVDGEDGTAGVDNISQVISENLDWVVKASATIVGSVSGRIYTKTRNGYNGAAQMDVVRTFSYGPPTGSISIHQFFPVTGTITMLGVSVKQSASYTKQGKGDISIFSSGSFNNDIDTSMAIAQFGPIEHSGISDLTERGDSPAITNRYVQASGGSVPGGGTYPAVQAKINATGKASLELPTSSIPLTSGQTFIRHVDIKPWRLGWWIKEVYTAYVP